MVETARADVQRPSIRLEPDAAARDHRLGTGKAAALAAAGIEELSRPDAARPGGSDALCHFDDPRQPPSRLQSSREPRPACDSRRRNARCPGRDGVDAANLRQVRAADFGRCGCAGN